MRKSATVACFIVSFAILWGQAWAGLFGIGKADFNAFKSETNNEIAQQKNDISAVKLENGAAIARLETQIGSIRAELAAQAQAQASAVAGVSNRVSSLASGRDTIQTTTNDSDMIKTIFSKLMDNWYLIAAAFFTFMLSLMGGVWAILRYQASMFYAQLSEKDARIERERESRARKEEKLDEWQQKTIEKLFN